MLACGAKAARDRVDGEQQFREQRVRLRVAAFGETAPPFPQQFDLPVMEYAERLASQLEGI
jgi:hypothetical protein